MDKKIISKIVLDLLELRDKQTEIGMSTTEFSHKHVPVPNINHYIIEFIISFIMDKYGIGWRDIRDVNMAKQNLK